MELVERDPRAAHAADIAPEIQVDGDAALAARRSLRAQIVKLERELSDPRGAIPEIHDKLHLVGDKEAIIYLKRSSAQ